MVNFKSKPHPKMKALMSIASSGLSGKSLLFNLHLEGVIVFRY